MHKSFLIFITVASLSIACNDARDGHATDRKDGFTPVLKTKEDSLYHEVSQGHDIGMAEIGKVRRNLATIQHMLDSINALPAAKQDEQYQQALIDLQEDLNYADYSMNTWMDEFVADSARDNKELRIRYLESEKEKVTKVKENILGSLQRADSLLKK